jgi:hypothetical protein
VDNAHGDFVASIKRGPVQVFAGRPLTPLSVPLPFFAYPFLAVTLFGWAWAHLKAGTGGQDSRT